MSRVAKNPIVLPQGVDVSLGSDITVKGPLGSAKFAGNPAVHVEREGESLLCKPIDGAVDADALSGTVRAILANMVIGVSKGFERRLTLVGVGYRAQAQGDTLNLTLGFSHPVAYRVPAGIKCETPSQTEILIKGVDKQLVGQVAAKIRGYRPPEPYKGKGVRYADESVVLKETKKK
ncbi:MAG: 50S ribosomal protein L6 [Candidatus Accumulibacter sp.]|jgi:large subunit ribosomal protein L6|nr:50S ribosomal protein L6 [Accumulibacter sp.]